MEMELALSIALSIVVLDIMLILKEIALNATRLVRPAAADLLMTAYHVSADPLSLMEFALLTAMLTLSTTPTLQLVSFAQPYGPTVLHVLQTAVVHAVEITLF